ncbi:MAG TPA: NAD-glutamate dehydrogenase domain-containing protein [Acidimicrobiales bacterium]|nr:NAD-glutamate dehydrogenase domain-containing protein [Acidimicrobiales bacterium]
MAPAPERWATAFAAQLRLLPRTGGADGAYEQRQRFLASLPPGYPEETSPEAAARDWQKLFALMAPLGAGSERSLARSAQKMAATEVPEQSPLAARVGALTISPCREGAPGDFRLRRAGLQRVEISALVPVFQSFGLAVVEAVPWRFAFGDGALEAYVDDFGARLEGLAAREVPAPGAQAQPGVQLEDFSDRLVEAVEAVLTGSSEVGPLNRLVLTASLGWRDVNLLSAYLAYRQLSGGPRAAEHAEAMGLSLTSFPAVAVAVLGMFKRRLVEPDDAGGPEEEHELEEALAQVPDLGHYEPLQEVVSMVRGTVRSSWSLLRETISLKFDSGSLPFLSEPKPWTEVFVWSPSIEGFHLRFGPVARGGIRWSERRSDLRSEVLGLARAQVKKNSLIIPTGAKGAFVVRAEGGSSEQGPTAYSKFVASLLDVTDNLIEGVPAHPNGVKCLDGYDPYLVVAADKGTATFSDLANELSARRSFWLGDAFASGGSHGYDHKALGITARGAWLAVQRHFRALGMDAQADELRVVGVGDMSGDVFGNGLLQSKAVRLIAAFDHRHIFVDPSPVPEAFAERGRLSQLAGSSWADYDLGTASKGAIVVPRQAKQVEVSAEVARALGAEPGTMSPPQLVRAVLQAPVDLIFFGGIGTFVKARDESDLEVDDADNDEVRVSAEGLRARVIAEGANLAMTQRARVAYSRRGGRVNTDFVDNAAGVAMSDREVNLKILLGPAISQGRLDAGERDRLLAEAGEAAAEAVLAQVAGGIISLDMAAATSAGDLLVYGSLIDNLGSSGLLERSVEDLPGAEELERRAQAGAGLSRPELAVVAAYARSALARSVQGSPLPGRPEVSGLAESYFPFAFRELYPDLVKGHPLLPQIVCSQLANEVIRQMGPVWAYEVSNELGCELWQAAAAFYRASEVLGASSLVGEVDLLASNLPMDGEISLRLMIASAVGRLARWYMRWESQATRDGGVFGEAPVAGSFAEHAALRAELSKELGSPASSEHHALTRLGVPEDVAVRAARLRDLACLGEVGQVVLSARRPVGVAVGAWRALDATMSLGKVSALLARWPSPTRWERWQLHLLNDKVEELRARAVEEAVATFPDGSGEQAAASWLRGRSATIARARPLVEDLLEDHRLAAAGSRGADISLAAVAVAALEAVVRKRA